MKRIIFLLLFIPFFILAESINWFFILMDEIFFSSYKKITVKAPLYITGMPRTGTTFMHNILSRDTIRYTTMKLWEIAFAPSVLQKKIWILIIKADAGLNEPLARFVKFIEKWIFKKFRNFHPLSLSQIEEDEYLMIHNFSSALLTFFFPAFKFIFVSDIIRKKDHSEGKIKLRFYKNCIKKHLFVFGKNKTYLAKSPAHILRYNSMKNVFPDLKMIYMLRVPHQAIPSAISLFRNFNHIFHSGLNDNEIIEKTLLIADQSFHQLMMLSRDNNRQSFVPVQFEEFIENPEMIVRDLYASLHYEVTDEFSISLRTFCLEASRFISSHKYSLDKYHLTRKSIQKRYGDIYSCFYEHEIIL